MIDHAGNSPTSAHSDSLTDMYQVDPFGIVRRKWSTILFFVVCFVALALLYYFKAPKTFESWAKVYIDDRRAPTMTVDGEVIQESNVEKYLEIVRSHAVLAEAIDKSGIETTPTLAEADDPLLFVRENLIATPSDTKALSGVMKIQFQSGVEEDCQPILTNILTSFDSFIKRGSKNTGVDMVSTMNRLEAERKERFSELMKEIDQLMQKPFIQVIEGKVYNQYEGQASKLQQELDENASERLRFVALRQNLNDVRAAGGSIEDLVIDTIQDMNEGQLGGYTSTHHKYLELKVRERELMGEFGNEHPELTNVRQQIKMVDNMRKEQLVSALRSSSESIEGGDLYSIVSSYIDNRIRFFESHEQQLAEAIRQSKQKSLEITRDCERLSMLLAEREIMTNSSFEMHDRVQEYDVLREFDWQDVRVIDPASVAEQVAPSLPISLAAGLILGSLLGFVFAAVKEVAEKTFRSTDDISRQLGVEVVAQIPKFNNRRIFDSPFKSVQGDVVVLHRPQSQPAESFKALRTSIFFQARNDRAIKLIQVTSPSPADGKSTVAANLAVSIARSGKRVLLIDCDLRRSTQHLRFGLTANQGVTSVMAGEASFDEAVQSTTVEQLDLLAAGPGCSNPAEILTTSEFGQMLDLAKSRYDFVIIDTPPVLPVTDPVIISNYVDLVYMPMRIRKGVQVNAQKALEALGMVGRTVDGIIVNSITRKEGTGYGYGYGSYGGYGEYSSYSSPRVIGARELEVSGANGSSKRSRENVTDRSRVGNTSPVA